MVMAELSMVPLGTGESLSEFVAEVLDVVDRSGIDYRLTPMGTILEGGYDEVMRVVGACFARGEELADRISLSLKIDSRKGSSSRLGSKVAAVETRLGRELKKLS